MKGKNRFKRYLAVLLCILMVVSTNATSIVLASGEVQGYSVKQSIEDNLMKEIAEEASQDNKEPENKTPESGDTSKDQAAVPSEKDDEVESQPVIENKPIDSKPAEPKAETEKETEKDQPKIEEQKEVSEETSSKKTEKEKEEQSPAFSATYQDDEIEVKASAPEGTLPKGTTFSVTPIVKQEIPSNVSEEEKENIAKINKEYDFTASKLESKSVNGFLAYDISFFNQDGKEIEPNDNVTVTMNYIKAQLPKEIKDVAKDADVSVLHLEETNGTVKVVDIKEKNQVKTLSTTNNGEVKKVEFKSDKFSTFVIVWDFSILDDVETSVKVVDTQGKEIGTNASAALKDGVKYLASDLAETIQEEAALTNATFVKATLNSVSGTEIKSVRCRTRNQTVQYSTKTNPDSDDWKKLGTNTLYFVFEIQSTPDPDPDPTPDNDVDYLDYSKTATVANANDRTYNINLSASSSKESEGTEGNASIVLVLDRSASMSGSMQTLKNAANSFISTAKEKSPSSEIAVVSYGSSTNNTNFVSLDGSVSTLTNFVDGMSASGGTPMDAALKKAHELLNSRTSTQKYVVFFTDGRPGFWTADTTSARKNNSDTACGAYNYATQIKQYATLYAVGYGSDLNGYFTWDQNGGYDFSWYTGTQFLRDYIATSGKYYPASSSDLSGIFNAIADEVSQPMAINAQQIVDVIDSRFKLTEASKTALKAKYGRDISIVENADGTTAITWSGDAAVINNVADGGWHETITVQAKDDFVGGNVIPTNGAGSGIQVNDNDFVNFQKPTVNVKLLGLNVNDNEKNYFIRDNIDPTIFADTLASTAKIIQLNNTEFAIPANCQLTNADLVALLEDGSVEKNYSYGDTADVVGKFVYTLDGPFATTHEATEIGNNVEEYTLTISFIANTETGRKTALGSSYTNAVGTKVTTVSDDGIYAVHVVAGSIQIAKNITGQRNPGLEGDPIFTFKIQDQNGNVWYRTVRFSAGQSTVKAELLKDLPRGNYTVTELNTQRYTLTSVSGAGSNCKVATIGKSLVVSIGTNASNHSDVNARNAKAMFTNDKTGDSGKRTDTDVVLNRFVKNPDGTWSITQVRVPQNASNS